MLNLNYGGLDYTYILFVIPPMILSFIAQAMVKGRFSSYSKVASKKGVTGAQAAEILMRANGINNVQITHISGSLTDNYNPSNMTLNLSDSTYSSTSIAAIGVAAHETGHAIQHKVGYGPLVLRKTLVPAANFGSKFGPIIAILGIILGNAAAETVNLSLSQLLINVGLILFSISVLFYVITLPVEINASRRALAILKDTNTLYDDELKGARKVLTAAAWTYIAAALSAIGSLLRLLFISKRGRSRR